MKIPLIKICVHFATRKVKTTTFVVVTSQQDNTSRYVLRKSLQILMNMDAGRWKWGINSGPF